MTDLGMIARAAKRVTLDDVYSSLDSLKDQQAEGFRHLNQRIDTEIGQVRQEIGQVNQRIDTQIGSVRQEIGQLNQRLDTQTGQIRQEIGGVRQEIGQLNQRFDTVIQMLLDLSKQISSQKSQ